MIYVLILIIHSSSGMAVTTQEFNTLGSCDRAGQAFAKMSTDNNYLCESK